MATHRVIDQDN